MAETAAGDSFAYRDASCCVFFLLAIGDARCSGWVGTVLIVKQLCRSFREGDREHRVLDQAQAEFANAEVAAVIGRSGSGKSTLLNLISGIDRPDSGSVEIDGLDVTALAEPRLTLFRRKNIGFVYQFFNLVPTLPRMGIIVRSGRNA